MSRFKALILIIALLAVPAASMAILVLGPDVERVK